MEQYHNLLRDILENGEVRDDRTGIGTTSVFGRQLRFDLTHGFPAVTTKKLAWRAVTGELLWFLEGSGDERRLAELTHGTRQGVVTIWSPNAMAPYWTPRAKFDGDLQKVYGYQWRKWNKYHDWENSVTLVKQVDKTGNDSPYKLDIPLETCVYDNADDFVGKTFKTKQCGEIKVLQKLPARNGNTYYKVQFLEGIHYITECSRPSIKSGTVKNPYAMLAVNGEGCYGIVTKRSKYLTSAYNIWYNMMERCHGSDPSKTEYYKNRGVFVDSDWRCFSNFYRDIHGLIGFDFWSESPNMYDLDKDYYGNNFYGRESTLFLPARYNKLLAHSTNTGKLIIATNKKTREVFKFTSPVFFNKHTKTNGLVDRAFLNQNGETRIWKFIREDPPPGFKWRQEFVVDQVTNLIKGIKEKPHDRRHIITAWNPGEIEDMALPPCHVMSQFYVSKDKKLSCHMYQRSVDVFLGLPFNIASYALLTHMVAQVCDLGVKELIISTGDTHIYHDHVDQVKEQLTREEYPLPTIWLKPDIKDIGKFTMDDIKLENYQSHGAIKANMAV
jgi:thymidylate synthase